MSLSTSLPDFKSRALAALQTGQTVSTLRGSIIRHESSRVKGIYLSKPYECKARIGNTLQTFNFDSAALAVSFLATL